MSRNEGLFLISIGNVCRQWSYLEYLLTYTIWDCQALDRENGIIITKDLDIRQLLDKALEVSVNKATFAPIPILTIVLTALKTGLEDLKNERNRIVHGVYTLNVQTDEMCLEHHRQNRSPEIITSEEISELGTKIAYEARKLRTAMNHSGIGPT